MNKFFAIIFTALVSVCSFAVDTYKAPSLLSKDKENLMALMEVAPNEYAKLLCATLISFADKDPATFEELCATIDKLAETYKATTPAILNLKKAFHGRYPQFTDATYALVKSQPSPNDVIFILSAKSSIPSAEKYAVVINCLVKFHKVVSAYNARQGIEALIEYGVNDPTITTQKEDLQKLNRLYSPKVLRDKASWEPVASMIRTALATY